MKRKLLIIGGVAGGATAAARARRLDEHAEIVLFERGEFISFANCGLPYYVGEVIPERDHLLVTTREAFMDRYRVDVRIMCEVRSIDRAKKEVTVHDLSSGENYQERYDKIILSPGAEPLRPPLPGVDLDNIFHVRSIPDTDRIKAFVDEKHPKSAIVVGGGFIGLEMAENLTHRGVQTTIVEKLDQVMAPLDFEMAAIIHAHLREKGVILELGTGVSSFSEQDGQLVVSTDQGTELMGDMIILSVGVKPENRLAREAGLEIGQRGGIVVKPTMQTSDPDIFAVGDAVEIKDFVTGRPTMTALAGPANKQGRIAADNAFGRRAIFKGTQGTVVVKVFDLTVAATGPSEKVLVRDNIPYLISYTHSGSHASYYPGATMMAIKLAFSPGNGRVLGAQIVGKEGVDKRIDVIATAIRGNLTVFDLEELELAYAPPYSSAKDPINIAGFVASNILKGDLSIMHWSELEHMDPEKDVLIDLRQQEELDTAGSIPGARHIPMNDLREALKTFDPDKKYITTCAVGLRAYLGYRILIQNGFDAISLSGGYKTLLGAKEEIMKESPQARVWLGE